MQINKNFAIIFALRCCFYLFFCYTYIQVNTFETGFPFYIYEDTGMKVRANVRLSDVARHAGISTSTVSRVLNNQPGISDATRMTVLEVLRTLNYNSEAIDGIVPVRDSRMRIDVVICPLAEQKNPMGLDYYGVTMDGIRSAIDSSKINMKLNIFTGDATEVVAPDCMGILLVGTPSRELREELRRVADVPCVVLSNNVDTLDEDLVTVDKFNESLRLCDCLTAQGVKRLGLLIPKIDMVYSEGFRCGMIRNGQKVAEEDIYMASDTDLASFVAPIHRMLAKESLPDALVVASYSAADFCTEMFQVKGIRVPQDIRMVAFSDDGGQDKPEYITARFDTAEMGRLAMERLLHKIGQPNRKSYRIVVPALIHM